MTDFFNFENREFDIPFYNNNPKISKFSWILMLAALVIGYISYLYVPIFMLNGVIFTAVPLIAILYYLKWDYRAIFRKPSLNDLKWAVAMALVYTVFSVACTYIPFFEDSGNFAVAAIDISNQIASLIFTLMGEELFKFIMLAFFLCILYKLTNNRKGSIVISMILSLILFGFAHYIPSGLFFSSIIIQGLGSVVHLFLYVKTKNLVVSYISHILTDIILTLLASTAI